MNTDGGFRVRGVAGNRPFRSLSGFRRGGGGALVEGVVEGVEEGLGVGG
jgi:hypothetical protein